MCYGSGPGGLSLLGTLMLVDLRLPVPHDSPQATLFLRTLWSIGSPAGENPAVSVGNVVNYMV